MYPIRIRHNATPVALVNDGQTVTGASNILVFVENDGPDSRQWVVHGSFLQVTPSGCSMDK
jgi:hypothetical protein